MVDMIEVKTADLIGPALDYAVAVATGYYMQENLRHLGPVTHDTRDPEAWRPSANWAHGGPLIEKYKVMLSPPTSAVHRNFGYMDKRNGYYEAGGWGSTIFGKERKHRRTAFNHPDSPLIVAMRAIVQFELGDTVQVPKELMP